mmetsp:Transcript_18488/g.27685  ORF Transcript_18488/g.27685 Transcript_18488/m.27685 type:complete len:134 (+) Transcript_18488:1111-1512(+)
MGNVFAGIHMQALGVSTKSAHLNAINMESASMETVAAIRVSLAVIVRRLNAQAIAHPVTGDTVIILLEIVPVFHLTLVLLANISRAQRSVRFMGSVSTISVNAMKDGLEKIVKYRILISSKRSPLGQWTLKFM